MNDDDRAEEHIAQVVAGCCLAAFIGGLAALVTTIWVIARITLALT